MARPRTGFAKWTLALALLAPGLLAGEVVPASKQFEIAPPAVSWTPTGRYDYVAATALSLGPDGFAVGWETAFKGGAADHNSGNASYFSAGRRLLPNGTAAETFSPNTWIDWNGWLGDLTLARLGDGRFVSVACTSADVETVVWFRRFAAGQAPLDPESINLAGGFPDGQSDFQPRIASNNDGLFVIAWSRRLHDPAGQNETWQTLAKVFDADGRPVSPEIAVTELVPPQAGRDPLGEAVVGMDAGGDFVVLWTDLSAPLHPIWGRRFDRTGNPLGDRFPIGSQGKSSGTVALAMAPSGEFVAAWRAPAQPKVMLLSRFTADGGRTGPVVRLAYEGADPAMARDRSGRVALFWIDGKRPALAVFDASLARLGPVVFDPPASLGVPWAETPTRVGVSFGDDGRILTVWVGPRGPKVRDSILGRFWKIR